ncbi:hypothetical protein CHARACLAT_015067 [Characodon lateralis]|uniref:Uncharacterized protein n=1 Tax=Characodon lateralis TaxID=208331 RepID=A0ABU7F334_9TELE|nr:hypothetical protein [Characodon lateralis]
MGGGALVGSQVSQTGPYSRISFIAKLICGLFPQWPHQTKATFTLQANTAQIQLFHGSQNGANLFTSTDIQIVPLSYVVLNWIHIWWFSNVRSQNDHVSFHPTFTSLSWLQLHIHTDFSTAATVTAAQQVIVNSCALFFLPFIVLL